MNELKIPKRLTTALVNSMTAGVVPRVGLEYIAVGRKPEVESILRDMDNIAEGGRLSALSRDVTAAVRASSSR